MTVRPLQTRFRFGYVTESLNLANKSNSQVHYAKGTPSLALLQAPTAYRQTGSGTVSLLCSRCFSPFPHGTGSLSVSREYLALRDGPRRFRQDFTCPALLRILLSLVIDSCTGLSPSVALFPAGSTSITSCHIAVLQPQPCRNMTGLGSCAVARHYWRNHYYFLFLQVLRCFSSLRLLTVYSVMLLLNTGLPHSDIPGSRVICTSPELIAACHVLRRLREPRHPPSALLLLFPY